MANGKHCHRDRTAQADIKQQRFDAHNEELQASIDLVRLASAATSGALSLYRIRSIISKYQVVSTDETAMTMMVCLRAWK
jgi:hypothetical protein